MQNGLAGKTSFAIGAKAPPSSHMSSLMARCEEFDKVKENVATFTRNYKHCLQNPKQYIQKMHKMFTVLSDVVACF